MVAELGAWSKTPVDMSAMPPELRAYLEARATTALRTFAPRLLLLNMRVSQQDAIRYAHQRHTTCVLFGDNNYDDPSGGMKFGDRRGYFRAYMEADPGILEARLRLQSHGIRTFWDEGGEYKTETLELLLPVNDDTLDVVLSMAKRDAGVVTPAQSLTYDHQFDLFFKQNYASDWEVWRQREPLVEQP